MDNVKRLLFPPSFEDPEQARIAGMLHAILLTALSLSLCFMALVPIVSPNPQFSWTSTGLMILPQIAAFLLLRRRLVLLASALFVSLLWVVVTLSATFAGGVRSASFSVYTPIILIAGLLLGWRAGALFIGLSTAAGLAMLYGESRNMLPEPLIANTPVSLWTAQTAAFMASAALLYLAIRSISNALERARRNERALAASYHDLRNEIVERERFEAALRESEETYRLLVNNANEGIVVAQDGLLKFHNPEVARVTGYSAEELAAMPFVKLIHPDDREMVLGRYLRRLGGGAGPVSYPFRIVDKAGVTKWVDLSAVRLAWQGQPAVLCFLSEITERKRLEEQLRQAQKMEAIGTLAGGIAHDFNNILTEILGTASVAQQDLAPASPLHRDIEDIVRSAKRAADLTQQLLTFARRAPRVGRKILSLNAVVEEVVRLLQRTVDRAISIDTCLAPDLQPVEGDASQLHQMLLNLCLNARDAMPRGGRLIIETFPVCLGEQARSSLDLEPGEYVVLSVSDTGIGMDAAVQEHLFEPFFTTKEDGQGLGLAMVYGIARGHNGAVHVYSEPGAGSTFKVYLPAQARPDQAPAPTEPKMPLGSETVLVVDDEQNIRGVLQRMLQRGGYRVLLAEDGLQALDLYHQQNAEIDLVVLDLIMPGLSGEETFAQLRAMNPQIKVLLSSGYSVNGHAAALMETGATGFLQKPYDLQVVLSKVREVLDA